MFSNCSKKMSTVIKKIILCTNTKKISSPRQLARQGASWPQPPEDACPRLSKGNRTLGMYLCHVKISQNTVSQLFAAQLIHWVHDYGCILAFTNNLANFAKLEARLIGNKKCLCYKSLKTNENIGQSILVVFPTLHSHVHTLLDSLTKR